MRRRLRFDRHRCRQSKIKGAAATRFRLDPNFAAVQLHKRFGDGETESGAFGFGPSAYRDLVELFEDSLTLVREYTCTRIGNRNPHPVRIVACRGNHYSPMGWSKFYRVADEV